MNLKQQYPLFAQSRITSTKFNSTNSFVFIQNSVTTTVFNSSISFVFIQTRVTTTPTMETCQLPCTALPARVQPRQPVTSSQQRRHPERTTQPWPRPILKGIRIW